jgi:hypothetical protein
MIDIDKKYRTRGGNEVRIYAVDGDEPRPVHGAFKSPTGWVVSCWRQDGTQLDFGGHYDLIEVKPRIQRTVWLALYPNEGVGFSPEVSMVKRDCLARVKVEIDCEDGEGL